MTKPVLEIINANHKYVGTENSVLKDFSLTVEQGEFVCLLGPSGSGKTTTLRVASGLETPQQGTVSINGRVVVQDGATIVPPEKRGLGVMFQDFALFPHLSVAENIAFGIKSNVENRNELVEQALKSVDMIGFADVYPSELSGGQQQRVSLARAIAPNPSIILLDEPFSHLDTRLKETLRDQTLHILKSVGSAGLMITHDAEEAMFMADKIIVMDGGSVLQVGTPAQLYLEPKTPFIAKFFGDVNTYRGVASGGVVKTPVGDVKISNDITDGSEMIVMVRPEGIEITECEQNNCSAIVTETRMLGMTSLVHLDCTGQDGSNWHMHARLHDVELPKVNSSVQISLKPHLTFTFPVE